MYSHDNMKTLNLYTINVQYFFNFFISTNRINNKIILVYNKNILYILKYKIILLIEN